MLPVVFPSPKSQDQVVGVLVEVSVNWTVRGYVPDVGLAVNPATGVGSIPVIIWDADVLLPPVLVAVRFTV